MWADLLRWPEDPARYSFEITDSLGQVIQTLPYSECSTAPEGTRRVGNCHTQSDTAQELADRTCYLAAALE
jgi:hypothetical protein